MSSNSILLVGAGGHGRACIDVIEQHGGFVIAGMSGLPDELGKQVLGYSVIATDSDLPKLVGQFRHALVTVGQIRTPDIRISLFDLLQGAGYSTPAIVSPRAYVSRHASVGEGTMVLHGAVINAGAVVGRNCIVNSQALLEHDTVVADHCHISTNAALNSGVRVGMGTFVGSGASVREGVAIGDRCVIGMGQRIFHDCESGTTATTPVASR